MSNQSALTEKQVRACAQHPVAAMLASRLPFLLRVILAITVTLVLLTVAMVLTFAAGASISSLMPINALHTIVFVMVVFLTILAAALAAELRWMHRHSLQPGMLCDLPEASSGSPVPDSKPGLQEPYRSMNNAARQLEVYINRKEEEGSGTNNRTQIESLRSAEVLAKCMVEMLRIGRIALDEKDTMPKTGTGAGFRNLEHTRTILGKMARLSNMQMRALRRN